MRGLERQSMIGKSKPDRRTARVVVAKNKDFILDKEDLTQMNAQQLSSVY